MTVYQQASAELKTVRDFLRFGETVFRQHHITCGHGYAEVWDEVVALVLYALHLPQDCDPRILDSNLISDEKRAICHLLQRRAVEHVPTAYLIHEAWFAGLPFWVSEDVLIPRSPLAELIEAHFQPWLSSSDSSPLILELCTGSGCIAIATAMHMPDARIVATDISTAALQVAQRNIDRHAVTNVKLLKADVWDGLPEQKAKLIISNPPYVASDEYQTLAKEFFHEPKLGLVAEENGLAIVRRILAKASDYLTDDGILIVEVGNTQHALQEAYPEVPFCWLEFSRGGEGVFMLRKEQLDNICGGE